VFKEDNPTALVVLKDCVLYRVPTGILEEYAVPERARDCHFVDNAVLDVCQPQSGAPVVQDQVLDHDIDQRHCRAVNLDPDTLIRISPVDYLSPAVDIHI
jgi:hypothetical protein